MILKSFGCSFVFGTDLPNDGRHSKIATPSDCSWPALMASKLQIKYQCHARPGAGNFEILQRILDAVSQDSSGLFVINWTWIDRFSYIDDNFQNYHPMNPLNWRSIMPVDTDQRGEFYYRELHTQRRDKMESLTAIKCAIDALQQSDAKFIMTWTDNLLWETQWHANSGILWLQDRIYPHMHDFDGTGFLQWSQKQGFKISNTMHPLIEAHEAASELWLPLCRQLIDATQHTT